MVDVYLKKNRTEFLMTELNDNSNPEQMDRNKLADYLRKQAIIANYGRLIIIIVSNFASEKNLRKLGKREGQEIQIDFPCYDIDPNSITFVLTKLPMDPFIRASNNPKATVIFNVSEEKIIPMLTDIVSTKYNIFGFLKIIFKYILPGRIRYRPKWAIGPLIALLSVFLIGKNKIFKEGEWLKNG